MDTDKINKGVKGLRLRLIAYGPTKIFDPLDLTLTPLVSIQWLLANGLTEFAFRLCIASSDRKWH